MTSLKTKTEKKRRTNIKNRFRDVVPYDSTRVRLSKIGDDDSTDYINANWVSDMLYDFRGEEEVNKKCYISAQGPINRKSEYKQEEENTCPAFWRMIWENGVEVIVMLTKLSEDMRELEKCSQYWPNLGEALMYDDVKVINDNEETTGTEESGDKTIVRRFTLVNGDEKKNLVQIQYEGWPDHGVPKNEGNFLQLTDKVDSYNTNGKPLLVHCSAGVGRSGTFCAIHSYVRYLKSHWKEKNDLPDINVPQRLIELRKDRPKMIQTKEQYEFVYRAIYHVFGEYFDIVKKRYELKEKEKEEKQ